MSDTSALPTPSPQRERESTSLSFYVFRGGGWWLGWRLASPASKACAPPTHTHSYGNSSLPCARKQASVGRRMLCCVLVRFPLFALFGATLAKVTLACAALNSCPGTCCCCCCCARILDKMLDKELHAPNLVQYSNWLVRWLAGFVLKTDQS